jgi:hypothetical protein
MQSIHLESIISNFNTISLQEMDEVKLMNRVDTKFAFNRDQFLEILPKLCSTYQILEVNGIRIPSYQSLYLDDTRFKFYLDHHSGRYDRYKVRFRNYIESNLTFLEIKHKTKGRTKKSRISVNNISEELNERELDFLSKNTNITTELVPKLWNSFKRITLVNNTLKERLTFDFQLVFKWESDKVSFDNLVIAELKQEKFNRQSAFFSLMKSRMIRPYRLSKYCIGAIELYGTDCIKYNRFKEKLIKLKQINNHDTLTISNA